MPKESTHLFLSRVIRESLSKSPDFKSVSGLLEQAPNLFMMGSVAPDSVYNYVSGPAKEFLKINVENSHGGGESGIYDYFIRFGKQDLPFIPGLSFGLGILCHLAADMIFHPMVYYFCGADIPGKMTDATVRHYYFESGMDKILRWVYPEQRKVHLKTCLRNKEMDNRSFALAQEALHVPYDKVGMMPQDEFLSMYRQHAQFEGFYGNVFFKYLAQFINAISGGAKPDYPALFYADLPGHAGVLEADAILNFKFEYKNPVSGVSLNKSLLTMIEDFKILFLDFLHPLESALTGKDLRPAGGYANSDFWNLVLPIFRQWLPRSPKTGLPAVQDGKMRYFDLHQIEEILKPSP
ncbi:MAG: zinc dependent phospholipase C family protein [Spirochaetales bacterium]|nr:zinc dependent phospholipase C family protein [Spirochaetales bacterium]